MKVNKAKSFVFSLNKDFSKILELAYLWKMLFFELREHKLYFQKRRKRVHILKATLTLNDLYDATCMTHNRFSNFHCAYTSIQVTHTAFMKVVCTDYSPFKSSGKMIQEQAAAAAVIIALISEKNKSRKNRKKKNLCETFA